MVDLKRFVPLTPLWFEILVSLFEEPGHGYGMMRAIRERSNGHIDPAAGTMYLALQRMERAGLIKREKVGRRGDGPKRLYYRITPLGKRVAAEEAARLRASVNAAVSARLIGTDK